MLKQTLAALLLTTGVASAQSLTWGGQTTEVTTVETLYNTVKNPDGPICDVRTDDHDIFIPVHWSL